jgi:membrane-associated protease RseP (regulator of RpoE activity)
MNTFKTILLILVLATLEIPLNVWAAENDAVGHPITSQTTELSIPLAEMDDATLMQYALQLRETKPELFMGARGVLVGGVMPNSQAEKKGLQRGDIVIAYDEKPINSTEQLISTVQANIVKQQVELQFIRTGMLQTVMLQGGQIGILLTDITEEMSVEQLWNELFAAKQAKDAEKIYQLVKKNPNTTKQLQQRLLSIADKSTSEEAKTFLTIAKLLRKILSQIFFDESSNIALEMPLKQFWDEFAIAKKARNIEKIYQLFKNNPNAVKQLQKNY